MIFCIKPTDDEFSVNLQVVEDEQNNGSDDIDIQAGKKEMDRGMQDALNKMKATFQGINIISEESETCHFMMKDAVRYKLTMSMNDVRTGTDNPVLMAYNLYGFRIKKAFCWACVMIPKAYEDEYGEDVYTALYEGLKYINASAEVK